MTFVRLVHVARQNSRIDTLRMIVKVSLAWTGTARIMSVPGQG